MNPQQLQAKTYLSEWFRAARICAVGTMQSLINKVDVNAQDEHGLTALLLASNRGHEPIVRLLLSHPDININALTGSRQYTPLMYAVMGGYENIVRLILQKSHVNINAQDEYGNTALIWAAARGRENIIKLILQYPGIDVNRKACDESTALDQAIDKNNEHVTKLLLQIPTIRITRNTIKRAIIQNNAQIFRLLLDRGIDVNWRTKHGETPLMTAIDKQAEDIIKLLLSQPKIEINLKDSCNRTALYRAFLTGNSNIIKLLLDAPGIMLDIEDLPINSAPIDGPSLECLELIKNKERELIENTLKAMEKDDVETVGKLVYQIGRNLEIDEHGNTFLHHAFKYNAKETALFLLQNSRDPQRLLRNINNNGLLPFELVTPNSDLFELVLQLAYATPDCTKISSCKVCKKQTDKLCSSCKGAYYCSRKCQISDWRAHKRDCKAHKTNGCKS